MQLSVRDVARLLKVPEDTVYRWVGNDDLPAQRVNSQYYFNKSELLEWAALHRIDVSPEIFAPGLAENGPLPTVAAALEAGGFLYDVEGTNREEVLRQIVASLRLSDDLDRETLLELLLARERHASTAVGDGIAIPHPRTPIVAAVDESRITLCYLKQPIPFGSVDGQPVQIIFMLLAPNVRTHLHLLAKLACLLQDSGFRTAIKTRRDAAEIIATARNFRLAASP